MRFTYTDSVDYNFKENRVETYQLNTSRITKSVRARVNDAIEYDAYKYFKYLGKGLHTFILCKNLNGDWIIQRHFTYKDGDDEVRLEFINFDRFIVHEKAIEEQQ